ncbi:MAG: DUF3772 domain-containing protein [Paracoccaceae bacterium]
MIILRAVVLGLTLTLWAGFAGAQEEPDFDAWQATAARAEQAIDANRASVRAFEDLRAEIADHRKSFLAAQDANKARINTLQSQLAALGPVPEGGEDEIVEARRSAVTEQLSLAQAPVIVAEEAYRQADVLIREIDHLIRERDREELLSRGPTPLNLTKWPSAAEHVSKAILSIGSEARLSMNTPRRRGEFIDNLPVVLLLAAIGVLLIARGGVWSERAVERLRSFGGRGAGVWSFLLSLFRIATPLLGLLALMQAMSATELVGRRGTQVLDVIPIWGAILLGLRWICERVFPKHDDDALIPLPSGQRAEARLYGSLLAILFIVHNFLVVLASYEGFSPQTEAIALFPQVVFAGLIFFRFGQILRRMPNSVPETEEKVVRRSSERVARAVGVGMMLSGLGAPLLAVFGYATLSYEIIYPMIGTAAIFALVLILQNFAADVYLLIAGKGQESRDSLIPVLVNFAVMLAAIPSLALFWGARVSDLQEAWFKFMSGVSVGGVVISPTVFLTFALVFCVGYGITRVLQGTLRSTLLPKTSIDTGGQNAIVAGLGYVGIFLASVVAITAAGIDLSSIALVAGALSVGIGFGLQTIVSNFVSGIILLIERPISEGDWIEVGGQMGYVRAISVRSTRIETFDRTDLIVPNADLISGTVTNFTRGNTIGRVIVSVGVAYGTETKRIETILKEIANAHPMVVAHPAPNIVFQGFGADALEFEIRAILRDVNWVLNVKSDLNHEIAKRFAEEGIEIPFAQRDIWLRNPEALKASDA